MNTEVIAGTTPTADPTTWCELRAHMADLIEQQRMAFRNNLTDHAVEVQRLPADLRATAEISAEQRDRFVSRERKRVREIAFNDERHRRASERPSPADAIRKRKLKDITARDINAVNAEFAARDREQQELLTEKFKQLLEKKPEAHAHRIMEAARIIVGENTLDPGHPYAAAARAAEKIEKLYAGHLKFARWLPNMRSRDRANKKAMEAYRIWERGCAAVLEGMGTAERVARYIAAKHLDRRTRDRTLALLEAGRL